MKEFINTCAVALTFVVSISLPFLTLMENFEREDSERKLQGTYQGSVLDLSVDTHGYEPEQLEKLENMNIEMSGVLRLHSSLLP